MIWQLNNVCRVLTVISACSVLMTKAVISANLEVNSMKTSLMD